MLALLLTVICLAAGMSPVLAAVTIYQDNFNDQQNVNTGGSYTQTLYSTVPTVRNAIAGGSASATWQAGVETGGWGQRSYNNTGVATPTSPNFLAFTPQAGHNYTVQATIDTTGAAGMGSSWFTVGFTSSQHAWNGADAGTIDTAHLVRFNDATSSTITYTVSGATLVAAGIQYVGWITDAPGVANLNPANQQVKIDNFSLTIQDENLYTNSYDANGATSGTVPVDGSSYFSNSVVTVLGNTGSLAKTGFNFAGWNTAADGSGTTYSGGSTFTITSNTTLYARWVSGYTVTYDGNGNTGGSVPVDGNTYSSGASATVLGNTGGLVKTGYTFANWNTAADGSGTSYSPASSLTVNTSTNLYAQWTVNQYTATYLAGAGGTISGTATQTVNYGTSTTSVTATPNAGYRFTGWSDAVATATRSDVNFAANFTVTANFDNNLTWNNGAGTTNWNTTEANWTGAVWNNGASDNAIFNNVSYTVNLTEAITGGSLTANFGGAPSGGHELKISGNTLSLGSILVWGGYNPAAGNGGVDSIAQAYDQRMAISGMTLNTTGDVSVKRGMIFVPAATVNVGGMIKNTDAWSVFREDNSTVTATGGIEFSVIASQVELNGGTVTTPFIKVGNAAFSGTGGLYLDGATVVPSQGSTDFLQVFNNGDTNNRAAATLLSGGLTLNSAYPVTNATVLAGGGGLTKSGTGTLTLTAVNTFSGNTVVSNGTLALSGSGSVANSPAITVAGGATFDVSGLSSPPFALGASQTLANSGASTANLTGDISTGSGATALTHSPGTPSFTTAGTLTLAAGTTLSVNNTGAQLGHGSHKFIAKTGGGSVTGTLPASYSVSGGGAATPNYLWLSGGELYLTVNNAPVAINTTNSVPVGGGVSIAFNNGKYPLATDADGDTLTITSVSAGLGNVGTDGSSINYTNTSTGASDSISYTVSDGLGGTDTKTITVLLTSATGANLVSATAGEGNAYLSYLGVPGYNYALDKANSLTPPITWVPQVTNTANGQGRLNYTNLLSLSPTNDFFRTRHVP